MAIWIDGFDTWDTSSVQYLTNSLVLRHPGHHHHAGPVCTEYGTESLAQ